MASHPLLWVQGLFTSQKSAAERRIQAEFVRLKDLSIEEKQLIGSEFKHTMAEANACEELLISLRNKSSLIHRYKDLIIQCKEFTSDSDGYKLLDDEMHKLRTIISKKRAAETLGLTELHKEIAHLERKLRDIQKMALRRYEIQESSLEMLKGIKSRGDSERNIVNRIDTENTQALTSLAKLLAATTEDMSKTKGIRKKTEDFLIRIVREFENKN